MRSASWRICTRRSTEAHTSPAWQGHTLTRYTFNTRYTPFPPSHISREHTRASSHLTLTSLERRRVVWRPGDGFPGAFRVSTVSSPQNLLLRRHRSGVRGLITPGRATVLTLGLERLSRQSEATQRQDVADSVPGPAEGSGPADGQFRPSHKGSADSSRRSVHFSAVSHDFCADTRRRKTKAREAPSAW